MTPKSRTALPLAGLALCLLISSLSWTVMRIGELAAEFDFDDLDLHSWITAAYIIAEVFAIPIAGKLIDHVGLKPVILTATIIFITGSATCAASDSTLMLSFFRVVQGIGGGFAFSAALTSPGILMGKEHRNLGHSIMTGAFAIGSLFGVATGYYICENYCWQYIFIIPGIFMGLGGALAYLTLPDEKLEERKMDWQGMLLLAIVMSLGTYYTQGVNTHFEMFSSESYALVLALILGIFALYHCEKAAEFPAFPKFIHVFQARIIIAIFVLGVAAIGLLQFYFKLYLLNYELDFYEASHIFLVLLIGGACTSLPGCRLVYRTGARPWVMLGCVLLIAAFILTALIVDKGINEMFVCMFVFGMGLGCIITELLLSLQAMTPREYMGSTTSVTMGLRVVGIATGSAIYSLYIKDRVVDYANSHFGSHLTPDDFKGDIFEIINKLLAKLGMDFDDILIEFNSSVKACALIAIPIAVIGLIVAYGMRDLDKQATVGSGKEEKNNE